jgi:hypothetical protein
MASYESHLDRKKFYATNQDDETFPITFKRATVIVKTKWGNVVFTKSNRGQYFHDSREPKKALCGAEVLSELERMLDSKEQAAAAFAHLQI